jgi:hypothetical protein
MQPTPRAGEVEKLPEHIAQFDESFSGCRQRKNTFPGRAVGEVFLGLVPFFFSRSLNIYKKQCSIGSARDCRTSESSECFPLSTFNSSIGFVFASSTPSPTALHLAHPSFEYDFPPSEIEFFSG